MSDVPFEDTTRPAPEFLAGVRERLAARRREKSGLSSLEASVPRPTPTELRTSPYEQAAAVLAYFEPNTIQPLEAGTDKRLLDQLLIHSLPITVEGVKGWTLASEWRITALRELRQSGSIEAAISANKRPIDPVQQALDDHLLGKSKPIENQTLPELAATYQVCGWLTAAGFQSGLPPAEAITRRTEWLTLLQPFEHLAGDEQFRGRADELQRLRSYAGVLPPGSLLESARRTFDLVFNLAEKPPMLITGPGGVGKSTLVARFILEHARAHQIDRFPFAYLDFDRPEVDAEEPLTLLIEAVRQLGIEYPEARNSCEKLRSLWTESIAKSRKDISTQTASVQSGAKASAALATGIRDFSALVVTLGANDLPILFVLDTFEEVQWQSAAHVEAIWQLLGELQAALPRLRVIIVGRADIEGHRTENLSLTGLDQEAAVAYLRARGITDEAIARRVARQIGGSPLSLKLAAELAQREGIDRRGRLAVSTHEFFFLRLDSALLQRQLYKRILSHVHDENVRRLAHPGLVLRRITPNLILEVLAQPCGINLKSLREANALFEQLKREVALVSVAPDGSVRHRQDLRLVTLELLRAEDAEKVQAINRSAVAYYEARPLIPGERAEEIYHRLQLDEDSSVIDQRWTEGLKPYLGNALEEFSGRRRAYLASRLNLDVDENTRRLADLQDWERITERRVLAHLAQDEPQQALDLMLARAERSNTSPLIPLEARALARLEQWDEALQVLGGGFDRAVTQGERALAFALALQAAEVVLASGQASEAARAFERLTHLGLDSLSTIQQLEALIRQLALLKIDPKLAAGEPDLRDRFRALFDQLPDEDLNARPGLGYWAATVFERDDAARLARVVTHCGLPRSSELKLRQLAGEITSLDVAYSRDIGEPPGGLARKWEIPVGSSVTAAWADFLLKGNDENVQKAIAQLLVQHADFVPARLVQAFASMMLESLGIRREIAETSAPKQAVRPTVLMPKHLEQLVDALVGAFRGVSELSSFVRATEGRNLEAISLGADLRSTVFDLVRVAEAEGWLFDLVAQLFHARPENQRVAALAGELGLTGFGSLPVLERLAARSPLTWRSFKSRLEAISAQICRVEVGGNVIETGFLVGVDLLLTTDFVLTAAPQGAAITLRFDYREGYEGKLVTRGSPFQLADDWIVAHDIRGSTPEGLGYALVRVAGSPGAQPIGGSRAESSERLRQWFRLPDAPMLPHSGEQLLIMMHQGGGPRELSMGRVTDISYDGQRVRYDNKTGPGSSGAPCFTPDLELVAMHLGADHSGQAFGVTSAAIVADLNRKGWGHALQTSFA
jgi:hypothetical protein